MEAAKVSGHCCIFCCSVRKNEGWCRNFDDNRLLSHFVILSIAKDLFRMTKSVKKYIITKIYS